MERRITFEEVSDIILETAEDTIKDLAAATEILRQLSLLGLQIGAILQADANVELIPGPQPEDGTRSLDFARLESEALAKIRDTMRDA